MSKTLREGQKAGQAAAVAAGKSPEAAASVKYGRKEAHRDWHDYSSKFGADAAHQKFGWKPTIFNRMSTSTKLTVATAPLMADPASKAWDRLHPQQPTTPETGV